MVLKMLRVSLIAVIFCVFPVNLQKADHFTWIQYEGEIPPNAISTAEHKNKYIAEVVHPKKGICIGGFDKDWSEEKYDEIKVLCDRGSYRAPRNEIKILASDYKDRIEWIQTSEDTLDQDTAGKEKVYVDVNRFISTRYNNYTNITWVGTARDNGEHKSIDTTGTSTQLTDWGFSVLVYNPINPIKNDAEVTEKPKMSNAAGSLGILVLPVTAKASNLQISSGTPVNVNLNKNAAAPV